MSMTSSLSSCFLMFKSSRYVLQKKKFRHFKINNRYNDYPLPKTKIVNLNLRKIKVSKVVIEKFKFKYIILDINI